MTDGQTHGVVHTTDRDTTSSWAGKEKERGKEKENTIVTDRMTQRFKHRQQQSALGEQLNLGILQRRLEEEHREQMLLLESNFPMFDKKQDGDLYNGSGGGGDGGPLSSSSLEVRWRYARNKTLRRIAGLLLAGSLVQSAHAKGTSVASVLGQHLQQQQQQQQSSNASSNAKTLSTEQQYTLTMRTLATESSAALVDTQVRMKRTIDHPMMHVCICGYGHI